MSDTKINVVQPGDVVEVGGRRFQAHAANTSTADSCRGCIAIGSPLCNQMPECSVIGYADVIYKDVVAVTL